MIGRLQTSATSTVVANRLARMRPSASAFSAALLSLALILVVLGPAPSAKEAAGAAHPSVSEKGIAQEEAETEGKTPELPNLIGLIYESMGGEMGQAPRWLALLFRFEDLFYALLSAGIVIIIIRVGTRRMQTVPGRLQAAIESFIEFFHDFIIGVLGPGGARYVPFLGSLFIYIWFMNLFGLIPLMRSPTAVLNTTAALAICVFLYVQWIGLRRLGPLKYLNHLAGDPHDLIGWILVPLMLPLHIISELARPVSLSLRLFGNILGEDVLIGVFAVLGVSVLAFAKLPIGIPLHLPFILLALLMSTVQAFVFTLLSTIYIMQVLPHEPEGDTASSAAAPLREGA